MKETLTTTVQLEIDIDYNQTERVWIVTCPLLPGFFVSEISRDKAIAEAEIAAQVFIERAIEAGTGNSRVGSKATKAYEKYRP